ncbi:MAG: CBS domain-containing protein [Rubrivivax sp.]|nr:CBS domain-containing protein [Rubrivivax sp.]
MHASALSTFRFPENTCIPQAQPKSHGAVTEKSPGIEVMTDLANVKAATIDPHTSLDKAEQAMIHQGVRSLFVVSNFPCVDGLITLADLVGEKPMQKIIDRHIRRQDLSVADVMTALSALDALDYNELKASNVGQVIATFKKLKHSHLLVVQSATSQGPARIRGVISLTQLERQLGRSVLEAMPRP